MNIKEAKQEIKNALRVYLRKDEEGTYLYPRVRQRPILLMGPPGIGKTAIMEQIAEESGVGLVAYTMTHHTRQSAIGLPHIEEQEFDGENISVTEYTMSEIIASVYDCMKRTGKREGILFIDEINCVSETLAPTMLQFLQNKTFGSHRVPDGWLIVAAGNPPEYNKSVREFDIVTLDRVRRIDISVNLEVWMEYARERQIHGAVQSYLGIREKQFYLVENTVDGKFFVTARGWEDLSELLKHYEELELPVSPELVGEFLQKEEIAAEFAAYYRLYQKYGADYAILEILDGTLSDACRQEKIEMAEKAGFEERFTVVRLLLDALQKDLVKFARTERRMIRLHEALKDLKKQMQIHPEDEKLLAVYLENRKQSLDIRKKAELLSQKELRDEEAVLRQLTEYENKRKEEHLHDWAGGFSMIQRQFARKTEQRKAAVEQLLAKIENAFTFVENAFGDGQELLLLVSGMSRSRAAMEFLSIHESEKFLQHSEKLLYRQREKLLQEQCAELLESI